MKVAFALPHGWAFSGWSISDYLDRFHFSKQMAQIMRRRGHSVRLFVLHEEAPTPAEVQRDGVTIEIHPIRWKVPGIRFGGDVSPSLLRAVRDWSPDVIHYHQYRTVMFPVFAMLRNAPLVAQYNGGFMRPVEIRMFGPAFRQTEAFIVPSPSLKRELRRARVPGSRIHTIPMPLRSDAIVSLDLPTWESPRLLYAGRIPLPKGSFEERDVHHLLTMFAELAKHVQATLTVVGDGPGLPSLRKLAQTLGVASRVEFAGYLPVSEWQRRCRDHALSLVPDVVKDLDGSAGASIQESLAIGLPIVTFSEIGVVEDAPVGWKIPYGIHKGAAALAAVLDRTDEIRRRGRDGQEYVRRHCTEDAFGDAVDRVYRTVLPT